MGPTPVVIKEEEKMEEEKYFICWESILTGYRGRGEQPLNKSLCEMWIKNMNEEYPYIAHWMEQLK